MRYDASQEQLIEISMLKIRQPEEYKEVRPGAEVLMQISVFSLGIGEAENVTMNYYIKDLEDKIIVEEEETVMVEKQASFCEEIAEVADPLTIQAIFMLPIPRRRNRIFGIPHSELSNERIKITFELFQ